VVRHKPGKRGSRTSGVTGIVWVGQTREWLGAKGQKLEDWGAGTLGPVNHGEWFLGMSRFGGWMSRLGPREVAAWCAAMS